MLTTREVIKTFYNALLQRLKKHRGDWNQNDPSADDYIKNRPFYVGEPVETVLLEESTVSFNDAGKGVYGTEFRSSFEATAGETYKVFWDGTVYECTCVGIDELYSIGNCSILGYGSDTSEPFCMIIRNGKGIKILTTDTSASHTFSISGCVQEVVKINEKYLPQNLATKSEVETAQSTANNAQSTANNAENTAISAQNIANSARNIANDAKTAADAANAKFANVLTIEPTGCIDIPTDAMDDGTYQVLRLISKDQYHATSFGVTESTGLQIVVDRDGGFQSSVLNPSTVDFRAGGGGRMRLKGIDELIMNSSTAGSTKRFKITVDDSGTLTTKAITE